MTPGPVTGRTPIDPGAAQRQLTEAPGEAADAGSSFADLLAAMLAPAAAGAPLPAAASAPAEAVFERLDAAEIFNETGLFRGAAPLPLAEQAQAARSAEAPVAPVAPALRRARPPALAAQAQLQAALAPPGGDSAPVLDVVAAAAAQIAADGNSTAAPGAPVSRAEYRAAHSLRGQPVSPPATPPQSGDAGGEAGAGRVSPRATATVAQIVAAKAGAAAAQVSVQAVEGGISVMARVDRLSREERDRLRIEIGELLARHGFGSAEILLNGEAWPLPQGKED